MAKSEARAEKAKPEGRRFARIAKRIAAFAGALFVVWYAVEGGEFGTTDLMRQRADMRRLQHVIDSLKELDSSLKAFADRLEHDPALQEKIAREQFGMLRDHELLYRFVDSARSRP